MKNLNIFLLIALAGVFTFTSCESVPDREISPETSAESIGAYFPEAPRNVAIALDQNSFTVEVARTKTSGASTVSIATTSYTDAANFKVPESVSFQAGQETAEVVIEVVGVEPFVTYEILLTLEERYVDHYTDNENNGTSQLAVSLVKEDYVPYAIGTYTCYFTGEIWEQVLEYSEMLETYRLDGLWHLEGDGAAAVFKWEGEKVEVKPAAVVTNFSEGSYGVVTANYYEASYDESDKTFSFGIEWTVAAGSFGEYPNYYTIETIY